MHSSAFTSNKKIWQSFSSLKKSVEKEKKAALHKRISKTPRVSDIEYLLGAFIEMYEPHLKKIIQQFAEKGYAIDPNSGFGGKNAEYQAIICNFSMDYILKNKLEKLKIKFREHQGLNSLIFWPDKPNLEEIIAKWQEIVRIFPDRGQLKEAVVSTQATLFRRKYIPVHIHLQKQRLFEKLKDSIQRKREKEITKRYRNNPHPDKTEQSLGLFVEELEPQVRQAVLMIFKKGYSTDASGFADNPCEQMIEGDFQLKEKTVKMLQKIGVQTETNRSGYTRLHFISSEADLAGIRRKWNKIAKLLPYKSFAASSSMTKKARDFRLSNH